MTANFNPAESPLGHLDIQITHEHLHLCIALENVVELLMDRYPDDDVLQMLSEQQFLAELVVGATVVLERMNAAVDAEADR